MPVQDTFWISKGFRLPQWQLLAIRGFGVGKRRLRFASFTETCVVFRPQTAWVRATTTKETKETKTKTKKNKIPAEMPNQNQNQNQKKQNPS